MRIIIAIAFLLGVAAARQGVGPGEQDWGYITVRPGAHMFYWLYYHHHTISQPLVIWLQGGPGASGTGYGNFEELGVVDINLNIRNYTWVNHVNVLFIDNPVGTGFSYVDSYSALTTTNAEIASDLVEFTIGFLERHPEFKYVPLYIFSESYGGKMAAEYAFVLNQAIKAGKVTVPLKGVALGDAWISPIDSVLTWAPFLLQTGMVDTQGYNSINDYAHRTKAAFDEGDYVKATNLWATTENVILRVTDGIDFYNILTKIPSYYYSRNQPIASYTDLMRKVQMRDDAGLDRLMNTYVKETLGIPNHIVWGGQGNAVFSYLVEDFMKNVTHIVERLLDETDLTVCVFTGHLDLIVDTPGTLDWVERLKWTGANQWLYADRTPLNVHGHIEGYRKMHGNFYFYWLLRSGHMVPSDNPYGGLRVLQEITHYK